MKEQEKVSLENYQAPKIITLTDNYGDFSFEEGLWADGLWFFKNSDSYSTTSGSHFSSWQSLEQENSTTLFFLRELTKHPFFKWPNKNGLAIGQMDLLKCGDGEPSLIIINPHTASKTTISSRIYLSAISKAHGSLKFSTPRFVSQLCPLDKKSDVVMPVFKAAYPIPKIRGTMVNISETFGFTSMAELLKPVGLLTHKSECYALYKDSNENLRGWAQMENLSQVLKNNFYLYPARSFSDGLSGHLINPNEPPIWPPNGWRRLFLHGEFQHVLDEVGANCITQSALEL